MIDMTGQMMYRVSNLNRESERISYQMSSGKVLENGSDDSILYTKVLDIESNIRTYNGLQKQVEKTAAQNNIADTTMNEVKTTLDAIKVDLMKALNAGMDSSSRAAIATNLKGLRANLLTVTNTAVDGVYLFSGSDTTIKPFQKDSNFELNGKISFSGDAQLRKVAVEPNTYRERGITAYDVLMYNKATAGDGEQLDFAANERVIDENRQEWKFRQVDSISFANIEKDDKFKVTINGEDIEVTAIDTSANTTANLLMQKINLNEKTSANVVATVDSNNNLILTAKESKNDFLTTLSTTEAGGNDTQYMLLQSSGKLQQYAKDGTIKEPTITRTDTLTVGGNFEAGDKFKVVIDNETIEVNATGDNDTTATAIEDAMNLNSNIFHKFYVTSNGNNIIIKPRVAGEDYTTTISTTESDGTASDGQTFTKASAVVVVNPSDIEEIDVDVLANRTDTIQVGGTFESGDKFIVSINGKDITIDANVDNATTASDIVKELNTNSDTKDVVKAIIDPNDNTKIIIKGKTNSSEFLTTIRTTEANGDGADAQTFTLNTSIATGSNATAIGKYRTKVNEITGTRFLEAKHNYFDDINIMINALRGYETNFDGTQGIKITDEKRYEVLTHSLDAVTNQYNASNIGHGELAGRNNIFNISLERIEAKQVHYNILEQKVGGADMSKLAMESKSLEMTYQALYSTVSKMHSLSLLNFIK